MLKSINCSIRKKNENGERVREKDGVWKMRNAFGTHFWRNMPF
jgi:hypothetical protein